MDERLNHMGRDLREEVRSGLSGLRAEFREDLGVLRSRFLVAAGHPDIHVGNHHSSLRS